MRRASILAAAVIGSLVASNSFAAFTFSTSRATFTSGTTQFDRVVLFGLTPGGAGTDIIAADMVASTPQNANGLRFSVTNAIPEDPESGTPAQPARVNFVTANPAAAARTFASNIVFQTVAPGFPQPFPEGPTVETYRAGIPSFAIAGFDGRDVNTTDIGLKTDASQNAGKGAAFFAAVVPVGTVVNFTGQASEESGTISQFNITDGGTVNVAPVVVNPAPQTVTFGQTVSNGAPFSATVNATDADASDILTLALGDLPAGVSGVTVSPAAGGTSPETFTVTGTLNFSTNRSTVTIPFSVNDGRGGSTPGAIVLNVVPEPTSLLALAGAAGIGMIRRRK